MAFSPLGDFAGVTDGALRALPAPSVFLLFPGDELVVGVVDVTP